MKVSFGEPVTWRLARKKPGQVDGCSDISAQRPEASKLSEGNKQHETFLSHAQTFISHFKPWLHNKRHKTIDYTLAGTFTKWGWRHTTIISIYTYQHNVKKTCQHWWRNYVNFPNVALMKAFYCSLFDICNIIKGIQHLKFSCHFNRCIVNPDEQRRAKHKRNDNWDDKWSDTDLLTKAGSILRLWITKSRRTSLLNSISPMRPAGGVEAASEFSLQTSRRR